MTKGPENSSSPIEHIGSTVAAILLRQRADAAVDVKNSMTAGNLAETIAALDRVNEAIKVADTVQRHLDGAVEGVKTDLGYFPSIRVAHLTQTDLEKPIGVQYQQITESAAIEPSPAIVAPSLAAIEPAIGIAPKPERSNVSQIEQSQPEADFATPGNQREEPVVEISTEPLVEILPKQVDTLAIIEAQVQPSQAEKLGSADLQLTPADNTLIKATEITVETPSIATVVVEHAPRQEVITTENQPQIEGISAQDQLIEAALWEASADNPVTKSHLIDLTGLSKTDLDLAMFKVRKQLEKAGFKVMNSNTKRGPGQVGQFYIQKNEEDPVQTAAKVSPDKSQVAESPSPDLVEDSKVSVIESAETSVNMIAEDTTLNVSEKESTSVGEADDISQYEALLSEIGSGNTYDGRMTALRQAVVFLRKNGSDQTIRGKGLTSLEQKIILAAIDVTEDGKPKNPNRKAIVAEAYADKVPFVESRLPFEVAQNNRFLKTAEEGLPGLIRSTAVKIDRARYTDEGLERTLVMYADLLDEDARTGDMSPSDLERLLRGDLTVHQHQMLLLKVEEDVKKKV